jgi:ribosomal protein L9
MVALQMLPLAFAVTAMSQLAQEITATNSFPANTYAKASFIPPAAPSSVGWPSTANPVRVMNRIATGYGTYQRAGDRPNTAHAAKKKGGGGGGGSSTQPVTKKGKIQVVLLQPVKDIGQPGDVVFVSSAIFQNQLKLSGKARLISDEEVAKMEQEKEQHEVELLEMAKQTKGMLEEAMLNNLGSEQCPADGTDICGVALKIKRKAGPDGNLFARVNPKLIFDSLKEAFPDGAWDGKSVKIVKMKDSEGADVKKMDIKDVGEYTIELSLGKGVDVSFLLSIVPE